MLVVFPRMVLGIKFKSPQIQVFVLVPGSTLTTQTRMLGHCVGQKKTEPHCVTIYPCQTPCSHFYNTFSLVAAPKPCSEASVVNKKVSNLGWEGSYGIPN